MKLKPVSVYIAAHYSRKNEVALLAHSLKEYGVIVTSTWHLEQYDPKTEASEILPNVLSRLGKRDLEQIREAEFFVLLSLTPDFKFTRGGHVYENGYADALGKKMYIVGPRQCIFHFSLPSSHQLKDSSALCDFFKNVQKRRGYANI